MTKVSFFTLAVSMLSASTYAFAPVSLRPSAAATMVATTAGKTALGMFTGIVEEMGTVVNMQDRNDMTLWDGSVGRGTELTVRGNVVMDGAYLGCSICVSGVCLTATVLDELQGTFTVGLAPETLDKTYFRSLQPGQAVNLERASEIGGRNSGHFVQGHVDGTGTIVDKRIDGDSLRITVQVDEQYVDSIVRYVVPKGFIAIDGTSLTVVDVDTQRRTFSFMLVEYTQKKIIIPQKGIGEKVNLEVDVLGKYSETAMASLMPRLEALEAKVESLERSLAAVTGGTPPATRRAAPPQQYGRGSPDPEQYRQDAPPPPPVQPGTAYGGYASDEKRMVGEGGYGADQKRMINEGPPPRRGRPEPEYRRDGPPPPPAQPGTAYGGYASDQKRQRMISEGTPRFVGDLGGDQNRPIDSTSSMMRPEGDSGEAPDDDAPTVRRVRVDPDPKMDDTGNISGNKFVRIDGS